MNTEATTTEISQIKPCRSCGARDRNKFAQCRSCMRESRRKWRKANLEKAREACRKSVQKWREANPEKHREYNRVYSAFRKRKIVEGE